MKCPNDGATLTMSERSGIEIDYCPTAAACGSTAASSTRSSSARSTQTAPPASAPAPAAPPPGSYERERDERRQQHDQRYAQPSQYGNQPYRKKRKESWLSEIFD